MRRTALTTICALAFSVMASVVGSTETARADEGAPSNERDVSPSVEAQPSTDAAQVDPGPVWTPPKKSNPGLLIAGAITSAIGAVTTVFGLTMIITDEVRHDDWFDGVGTQAGGFFLGIGLAHLAAGIPMLVVGATPKSPEMADGKPEVRVSVSATSASLSVDF